MGNKDKVRPPRVYMGKNGKRYIKVNGKKIYIQSNISNKQLVRIVINNFQKKQKRKRKNRKPMDKSKEFEEIEILNKTKSGSSDNTDLSKLLFHLSVIQKEKDDARKKDEEDKAKNVNERRMILY